MSKYNKTCILCGKKYKFCNDCREEMYQPTWKNTYCSENCRTIFNTIVGYAQNTIIIEDAYDILKGCDLTKKDAFREDFSNYVDEIISVMGEAEKKEPKKEEPKKEEPKVEDSQEDSSPEDQKAGASKKKKKR